MVSAADIIAGIAVAEAIVSGIIRVAPAIERGVVSSAPYVRALAGLLAGANATQEEIDAALARINAATDDFLTPLPPDDGTTTT